MADSIEDISNGYEREHFNNQDKIVERISQYYDDVIREITPLIAANASKAIINKKLDSLLTIMVSRIENQIKLGMQTSWEISNAKTKAIFEVRYKGIDLPEPVKSALNSQRENALQQFIDRREAGLNLSDRIWKQADQFKQSINDKIDDGIGNGKSAAKIARELRSELQDPTTQSQPGKGVYKSPVKNTERLTRTETNMSYRRADHEAWKANPLVLGYEIKLSATAKPKVRCELCTKLEGAYPVWFVWVGWHPNCLCFKIPILMSSEMLSAYNKLIAQGKDTPAEVAKLQKDVRIMKPPEALTTWIVENQKRVAGWARNPYWWEQNKSFVNSTIDLAA